MSAAPTTAPLPGPLGWLRTNLFSSVRDTILTIVFGLLLAVILVPTVAWLLTEDWEIVQVNMRNFLVGPGVRGNDVWGPALGGFVIAFCGGIFVGALRRRGAHEREERLSVIPSARELVADGREAVARFWPLIALIALIFLLAPSVLGLAMVVIAGALFMGGRLVGRALPVTSLAIPTALLLASPIIAVAIVRWGFGIEWKDWGGFLLVLLAGGAGIVLAFPLGLLLALGRRSKLPVIRGLSVGYIEFFRGVPLVVLLFIGSLVLGLVVPRSLIPDPLIRAIIIFTVFTSAYIAEIVRGGLQSLPAGQEEASKALGMPAWRTMSFIILPQALRNVIPALVGQAISLWKDTSLLFILGFAEPLRLANAVTSQPQFRGQGLVLLTLFFAALIYWVVSYTMSRESQRLERKLGVGTR